MKKEEKMKKHTPGPWVVKRLPKVGSNVFGLMNQMTANEFVATDWEANARLIEAAPELLQVAYLSHHLVKSIKKELADRKDKKLIMEFQRIFNEWSDQINRVLDKVEGTEK